MDSIKASSSDVTVSAACELKRISIVVDSFTHDGTSFLASVFLPVCPGEHAHFPFPCLAA